MKNTNADMPEVLVESMTMVFEVQEKGSGTLRRLTANCTFTPEAPVLVRKAQTVRYDCQLQRTIPPDAELRTAVEIRLLGSDQTFRLQI